MKEREYSKDLVIRNYFASYCLLAYTLQTVTIRLIYVGVSYLPLFKSVKSGIFTTRLNTEIKKTNQKLESGPWLNTIKVKNERTKQIKFSVKVTTCIIRHPFPLKTVMPSTYNLKKAISNKTSMEGLCPSVLFLRKQEVGKLED